MGDFLQYVELDTFFYRLDPRTKFAFFLIMSILISFMKTGVALGLLFFFFLAIWLAAGIASYMFTLAKKVKVLLLFIFLLWLVLGIFTTNTGRSIWQTSFSLGSREVRLSLEWFDIYKGAVFALRVYLMIATFYTVILTTNFSLIILGLRSWRIPYSLAFGIGLVFQIIPIVVREFATIMEAQSSRGLEVERCGALAKMKNYVIVSLPLLFRVLGKGHSISLAMYYYKLDFKVKRTSYKVIQATYRDAVFMAACVLAAGAAIWLQILYYVPL
jgi:energy-coupling factor transport system permease protein